MADEVGGVTREVNVKEGGAVMDQRLVEELREVGRVLDEVAEMTRFLLLHQLVKDGHAANFREAREIANDPARLEAIYPAPSDD